MTKYLTQMYTYFIEAVHLFVDTGVLCHTHVYIHVYTYLCCDDILGALSATIYGQTADNINLLTSGLTR